MAGRGSRFTREGRVTPKPLIMLQGRPLFAWAVESVRRAAPVDELVFVVLSEHIRDHAIDAVIGARYPDARLVVLDAVTGGAAETAALGVAELKGRGPFAINDCDHAFRPRDLPALVAGLRVGAAGALVGFASDSPAYSYVRLNAAGEVAQTAEKQVIGPWAIAGCYLFARPSDFLARFARYRADCPYPELFVSGLYDAMARAGERVLFQPLDRHVSFGAPGGAGSGRRRRSGFPGSERGARLMFDIEALMFDLDGTLVDTRAANYAAYAGALAEVGVTIDAQTFDALSHGRNWRWFLPRILGPEAADQAGAVAARKAELYPALVGEARPNPRMVDLAEAAHGHIPTCVVTTASASNARAVLVRHGLAGLFDLVVSGDDVARHKPDPEAYALAAARLGVEPARCLAFEDSDPGAASAAAAGMAVIRVGD